MGTWALMPKVDATAWLAPNVTNNDAVSEKHVFFTAESI
jgi:hypothetical protein